MTTTTHQTLTCEIRNLDQDNAVDVTWKDPKNQEVLDSDTTNYSLDPGSVNGDGNQEAVLTIKQVKMESFTSTFTYKCSVKSNQYPTSPPSAEIEVVAEITNKDTCESIVKFDHYDLRM